MKYQKHILKHTVQFYLYFNLIKNGHYINKIKIYLKHLMDFKKYSIINIVKKILSI